MIKPNNSQIYFIFMQNAKAGHLFSESPSIYLDGFFHCEGDSNLVFNDVNGLFVRKQFKITDVFSSIYDYFNMNLF